MPDPLTSDLQQQIRDVAERVHQEQCRPYGDSFWWERANLWEPTVQIALKDLCSPGSVAYDVGANVGGLTAVMSRLVGPRGVVCSFEASPRIFPHLQKNIIKQGFNNVTAYPRAVYSRTGELIKVYPGDHLNDSIYHFGSRQPGDFHLVETLSLDDFHTNTGLLPHLIKMDIEGAEFDALLGCERLIKEHKPYFILEQQPQDSRCLDLFASTDYIGIDLNNYRLIDSDGDYPPGVGIRNVLFLPQSRIGRLPYALPVELEPGYRLVANDFSLDAGGIKSAPLSLEPGRYLVDTQFTASGMDNELICGVKLNGEVVFQYHGYSKILADSYRDWVFDVVRESQCEIYFSFLSGTQDKSFSLNEALVSRIRGFRPSPQGRILSAL